MLIVLCLFSTQQYFCVLYILVINENLMLCQNLLSTLYITLSATFFIASFKILAICLKKYSQVWDIFAWRENTSVFFAWKQRKFLFIIRKRCGDIYVTSATGFPNGNAIFPTRRPSWIGVFLSKRGWTQHKSLHSLVNKNYDFAWAGAMSGLG